MLEPSPHKKKKKKKSLPIEQICTKINKYLGNDYFV